MSDILSVSGAAPLVAEMLGRPVPARQLSDLLYKEEGLRAKCPLIGHSRVIPAALLPELRHALETRPRRARKAKAQATP
jgi:hypothetical protein